MSVAVAGSPASPLTRGRDTRPTRSAAEFAQRVDALALSIGAKCSASALMLACIVVILIGAQSMLGALHKMDGDVKEMNEQLAIANKGLVVLNKSLDSVTPMAKSMHDIVATIDATGGEVKTSAKTIDSMAKTTGSLDSRLGNIAASTTEMRTSFEKAGSATTSLQTSINGLNEQIGPLAQTQHGMYGETVKMSGGLDTMNDSLAYVVRVMNYITAPPSGQDFQMKAELPKETLPPIPGIKAQVDPISVFARMSWPIFQG